jgi:hypothetical protein
MSCSDRRATIPASGMKFQTQSSSRGQGTGEITPKSIGLHELRVRVRATHLGEDLLWEVGSLEEGDALLAIDATVLIQICAA